MHDYLTWGAWMLPWTLAALMVLLLAFVLGYVLGWSGALRRVKIDPFFRTQALKVHPLADSPFIPSHRHRKGGLYQELLRGLREHDLEPVVVYRAGDGTIWTRSVAEFDDGRFAPIGADRGRPARRVGDYVADCARQPKRAAALARARARLAGLRNGGVTPK